MNNLLEKLDKLYKHSKNIVELIGILFLAILMVYSTEYFKTGEIPTIDPSSFENLTKGFMPYIWVGLFTVYTVGLFANLIIKAKSAYKKAKDPNIDTESKIKGFIKWFLES